MKFKAFTLAELLIAIAILGVIATFTIPKILTAQAAQQKVSIFKETIAALSAVHYQWVLEGNKYTSHTAYQQYVAQRINAIKSCPNDGFAEGCTTESSRAFPMLRLVNGATIMLVGGSDFDFEIDWNGDKLPNIAGDDYLTVFAPSGTSSYCGIKYGAIGFPDVSCAGTWTNYNAWKQLYDSIYH